MYSSGTRLDTGTAARMSKLRALRWSTERSCGLLIESSKSYRSSNGAALSFPVILVVSYAGKSRGVGEGGGGRSLSASKPMGVPTVVVQLNMTKS
jgi:hypothetical protein